MRKFLALLLLLASGPAQGALMAAEAFGSDCCEEVEASSGEAVVASVDGSDCCTEGDACASDCSDCLCCARASSVIAMKVSSAASPSQRVRFSGSLRELYSFDGMDEILHVPISSTQG